jgi:hypothetical protein
MAMDMMWFLMLSHFVGDYALQSDAMARRKASSRGALTAHVAVYVLTLAVTVAVYAQFTGAYSFFSLQTLAPLGVIFVLHWVQDDIKGRHFSNSHQAYYVDQAVHVAQLFLLRGWLG